MGEIKTAECGIYFNVEKNSSYSSNQKVILYDVEWLNIGGAMNLTTGVFTAPVNGIYQFTVFISSSTQTFLRVNKEKFATSYSSIHEHNIPIVAIIKLEKNDQVDTWLDSGAAILDDAHHHTQFSGILLHEDVSP